MVEHLLCRHKALSSNSGPKKKKGFLHSRAICICLVCFALRRWQAPRLLGWVEGQKEWRTCLVNGSPLLVPVIWGGFNDTFSGLAPILPTQIHCPNGHVCPPQLSESIQLRDGAAVLSLYSHFLHGEQEGNISPFSPTSPHFYPVILNSFPNKLYYHFYHIFVPYLNSFTITRT
jgi:hypothetical protein